MSTEVGQSILWRVLSPERLFIRTHQGKGGNTKNSWNLAVAICVQVSQWPLFPSGVNHSIT